MRLHAMRQKIPSDFGSLYLEVEYTDDLRVTQINLTHRGRMKMTVVGNLLDQISGGINDLLSDLRLSRGSGLRTGQVAGISAAAKVLPEPELAPVAPPRAPGPFSQGEQPFEGNGE
jgi:hypothetical protein